MAAQAVLEFPESPEDKAVSREECREGSDLPGRCGDTRRK